MSLLVNPKGELVTTQHNRLMPVNGFCYCESVVIRIIKRFGTVQIMPHPETIIYSIYKE